jgi:hypothetical protein
MNGGFMSDEVVNDTASHDNGNEKGCTNEGNPKGEPSGLTKQDLIEQLAAQVEHIESLPEHVKFYFCTNADLQYFMALVLHILKS